MTNLSTVLSTNKQVKLTIRGGIFTCFHVGYGLFYLLQGYFEFADGLRFEMENWNYCDGDSDRVFKSEDENGLKPAGSLISLCSLLKYAI